MMSSAATSSPVSASTLAYLMRWPVLRLIWLKLTFSVSDVAGYKATGQVTSERRKKPFQLARGAMGYSENATDERLRIAPGNRVSSEQGGIPSTALTVWGWRHAPETGCKAVRRPAAALFPATRPDIAGPQTPEHHLGSCVAFARDGAGADRHFTRPSKESRALWQRDGTTRLSKPRPRRARPSPGRRCSP